MIWNGRGRLTAYLLGLFVALLAPGSAFASTLDLPVPRVAIYPGDVISEDVLVDRAFIARTVTRSSIFDSRVPLIGKVAKRTLVPGQPIPVNAIRDPFVVAQGKATTIVFEFGGLVITGQAMPLHNAGIGEAVQLRNIDSGILIRGLVEADGTVRVGMQ